jgi:hypothetical protein
MFNVFFHLNFCENQMTLKIFKIENGKKIKMLQIPKLNYCVLRRTASIVPLISVMIDEMLKFGNLGKSCPINPGIYYLKNFPVEQVPVVAFFPKGLYAVSQQILDENKKAVVVWSADYNLRT